MRDRNQRNDSTTIIRTEAVVATEMPGSAPLAEIAPENLPEAKLVLSPPISATRSNSANKNIFDLCKSTFNDYKEATKLSPRKDDTGKSLRLYQQLEHLSNALVEIPYRLNGGGRRIPHNWTSIRAPQTVGNIIEIFNTLKPTDDLQTLQAARDQMITTGARAFEAQNTSQFTFFRSMRDPATQAVYEAFHNVKPLIEAEEAEAWIPESPSATSQTV